MALARPGRKQARKHVRDARDFNNIETELSSFFFLQGKAPKEIHAILTEILACFRPGRAMDLSAPQYLAWKSNCVLSFIFYFFTNRIVTLSNKLRKTTKKMQNSRSRKSRLENDLYECLRGTLLIISRKCRLLFAIRCKKNIFMSGTNIALEFHVSRIIIALEKSALLLPVQKFRFSMTYFSGFPWKTRNKWKANSCALQRTYNSQ